ncbi:MAG: transglycosylase SLT domain-containing protein [Gammaproteobacteria bacterium]|nr:transglycosylase SLT domain-containing protein [Gammaproteobacteria bacterium]
MSATWTDWAFIALGGAAGLELGIYAAHRLQASSIPAGTGSSATGASSSPGPSGDSSASSQSSNPCAPMTMFCLLHNPVGGIPVPDALAWVPAQNAADEIYYHGGGISLFDLAHHPVGYYGESLIAAQRAAAYLWDLGIDPCPPQIYADLVTANAATGIPIPLLLAIAHTESTFLSYGTIANSGCVPGACTRGNTGSANGGPIGLMMVSSEACAQVGVSYSEAATSTQANAIAAAKYLVYLAQQRGISPTSTDYAQWEPVLAAYGENPSTSATLASSSSWVAQHVPAEAKAAQAAVAITRNPAPPALVPAVVTCRDYFAQEGGREVTIRACSNGIRTIV